MAWAYRSAMQNEFLSARYQANDCEGCPNQAQQCLWYCSTAPTCPAPYPAQLCGDFFLTSRQVPTERAYLWAGVGMLWGYILVFLVLSVLALRFLRYDMGGKRQMVEDADAGKAHGRMADPEAGSHVSQQVPNVRLSQVSGARGFTPARQPQTLAWRDIVYSIDLPIKEEEEDHDTRRKLRRHREVLAPVELLKGVSGFARPFEMLALMGSSGAGKTTLLDVLAFRKTLGRLSAQFALGGANLQGAQFKRILCVAAGARARELTRRGAAGTWSSSGCTRRCPRCGRRSSSARCCACRRPPARRRARAWWTRW
jgi:hypothetical protein